MRREKKKNNIEQQIIYEKKKKKKPSEVQGRPLMFGEKLDDKVKT
jgi:hypothetical protein